MTARRYERNIIAALSLDALTTQQVAALLALLPNTLIEPHPQMHFAVPHPTETDSYTHTWWEPNVLLILEPLDRDHQHAPPIPPPNTHNHTG